MKITIERFVSDDDATQGLLRLDGKPEAYTLEDEHRAIKVAEETRIPAGTYAVRLRTAGSMTKRYARKFPEHQGMLWLQDVPGFEWIYLHIGNTEKHTAGCILVGDSALMGRDGRLTIGQSTQAYRDLYAKVVNAADAGELEIEIIDRDLVEN